MPRKKNRLDLDFAIEESEARAQYVNQYISQIDFDLTSEEMEQIANYILWGKDADGKNAVQKHEIDIETKSKTWDKKNTDSLDELKELPTFNEATLHALNSQLARPKIVREVFNREDVEKKVPADQRQSFYDLFHQIDYFDLMVGFYDLKNEKRDTAPREELTARFSAEDIASIKEKAESLEQYEYLKIKHMLVDLRRQQFTMMDIYKLPFVKKDYRLYLPEEEKVFQCDIPVLPLGLVNEKEENELIFLPEQELTKFIGDENKLKVISDQMWENRNRAENFSMCFDFREVEHVYNLLLQSQEIVCGVEIVDVESTLTQLLKTLEYYIQFADLDELQTEILKMKMKKIHNPDIAEYINEKYGTSYTSNYISTIFRQKIIAKIVESVKYHERVIENLCFEENFKKCNTCGRTLLIDEKNFVHKTRAQDGFANRCKCCDRNDRDSRRA